MESIIGKIIPEDLAYFSAFNLSLNLEFQFDLAGVNVHDFVASLERSRPRANISRSGTNMAEMARHFKTPQNYTIEQLEQYQKKVFSILNKKVSSITSDLVPFRRTLVT